jgi:hypothetical protein
VHYPVNCCVLRAPQADAGDQTQGRSASGTKLVGRFGSLGDVGDFELHRKRHGRYLDSGRFRDGATASMRERVTT